MSSKISKTLVLCSVLGALLFASAVPPAEAFPKPRAKASHLEKGKLLGWLSKLGWTTAFVVSVCGLQSCQPINETEVAQSDNEVVQRAEKGNGQEIRGLNLKYEEVPQNASRQSVTGLNEKIAHHLANTLPKLRHIQPISGEDKRLVLTSVKDGEETRLVLSPKDGEEVSLVYYVSNDSEARVGWLTNNNDDIDERILPYRPNARNYLVKKTYSYYYVYETVSSDAIAGKLQSIAYPMWKLTFSNEDGQVLSGNVFAQIIPLDAKTNPDLNPPYAVLVTHHDGQELEADDKYFTIMTDELPWIKRLRDTIAIGDIDNVPESIFTDIDKLQRYLVDRYPEQYKSVGGDDYINTDILEYQRELLAHSNARSKMSPSYTTIGEIVAGARTTIEIEHQMPSRLENKVTTFYAK